MSTQHTPASKHLKKPCILNVRSATGWQPVSQTCREVMITCVYSMNGTLEDVLRKCAGTGTHDFQHYILAPVESTRTTTSCFYMMCSAPTFDVWLHHATIPTRHLPMCTHADEHMVQLASMSVWYYIQLSLCVVAVYIHAIHVLCIEGMLTN